MIASNRHCKSLRAQASGKSNIRGYSLVELVVALTIVTILTAISIPYMMSNRRMYRSEDQALKIMDQMREAGQLALSKRRVMRIEIDQSNVALPVMRMIDENGVNPDILIKTLPLFPLSEVRMDVAPGGVLPPTPPNYAPAVYTANIWSIRFRSDGSVVNAADIPISATLYSWRPINETNIPFNISVTTPARLEEVRAVTIFGGSGAVRYWKHNGTTFLGSQ